MIETAVDGDPVEGYGLPPRVGGHVAASRPPRLDRLDPGDASATMRISTVTEDTGADATTRPGARDARCCLQATVCPPAHGPRPLEGFAARGWSGNLDFGTLEPVPASYVSRDLQQRHGDLVWRVRFSDERWLYLLLTRTAS